MPSPSASTALPIPAGDGRRFADAASVGVSRGATTVITSRYGSAFRPAISPNGKLLVFGSREGVETGLRIRELDTGVERWLAFPVQRDNMEAVPDLDVLPGYSFTPDGGAITISGRTLVDRDNDHPQTFVEVLFADTGIGIDPADQKLIFEKFYRVGAVELHSTGSTKFKGAGPGLGLPIARGVIQAHGGKIWVESSGHDEARMPGSTFHVVLPVAIPSSSSITGPLRSKS